MTIINPIINFDIFDISDNLICSICQDNLDEKAVFLECSHMFHYDCIMNWYNQNNQTNQNDYLKQPTINKNRCCPLCRKDIIINIDHENNSNLDNSENSPLLSSVIIQESKNKYYYGICGLLCGLTLLLFLNLQIDYVN